MRETTPFNVAVNALFGKLDSEQIWQESPGKWQQGSIYENILPFSFKPWALFHFSGILKEKGNTRILDFKLPGKTNFRLGPDPLELTFHADFSISKPFLALELIFKATEIWETVPYDIFRKVQ